MKLLEFLEKNLKKEHGDSDFSDRLIEGSFLKKHIEEIKSLDEFKNVKRINIIDFPTYLVSTVTGAPATPEDHMWQTIKPAVVETKPLDGTEFNDEIDLYSIYMDNKRYMQDRNLECGVWIWPTIYNPENFFPVKKIEIVWSPDIPQSLPIGSDQDRMMKDSILNKLSEALDNPVVNIPYQRNITIRCSQRSYKKQENEERN